MLIRASSYFITLKVKDKVVTRILIKYIIYQIYSFNFLTINNFSVDLGGFYVGMPKELARRIKVCTECQHHRCEAMATCMETEKRYEQWKREESVT